MDDEPQIIEGEFKAYDHKGKRSYSKRDHEPIINWWAIPGMLIVLSIVFGFFYVAKHVTASAREATLPYVREALSWLGL